MFDFLYRLYKYVLGDFNSRDKTFVLNLIGSGMMRDDEVPGIGDDETTPAMCFDVDLVDLKTNKMIGTATDCLSNVTATDDGVSLIGTSYFNLPGGTIVTRGATSVKPTLTEIVKDGVTFTHVTGASGDGNSIIEATGRYRGKVASVRLSGLVDMSQFEGDEGDPIVFNCVFIIEFI